MMLEEVGSYDAKTKLPETGQERRHPYLWRNGDTHISENRNGQERRHPYF